MTFVTGVAVTEVTSEAVTGDTSIWCSRAGGWARKGIEQPTGPKLAGEVNQGGGEEDLPEGDVREEQHGYAEGGGDQGDQEEAHS